MKTSLFLSNVLAAGASAHAIFQELSVNGVGQGLLQGLRAPNQNNPVEDVTSSGITCGVVATKDSHVITVPAGAELGALYQHVIGGAQYPGDRDNPIAASHKGPVTAWLAKVDSAVSADAAGAGFFKIAEENLDTATGVWGVDSLIANNGWWYFTLPECIAPGQYLLRVEVLALHSAYAAPGAQFYTSCAQIEVTGGGAFSPQQTVRFPGAYAKNDPAIVTNIYGASGRPDNNKQPYQAPGMRPVTC